MAISSSNTYTATIDTLVKDALVFASLMNPRQGIDDHNHKDTALWCRRALADIVHELIAAGVILRWTEFRTFTTTASTQDYSLGTDVQDVLGPLMHKTTSGNGETLISQIDDVDWQRLSAKDVEGVPTQAVALKSNSPIVIRLWPIPESTGDTVRYKAHVTPADMDDGSKNLDMPDYWRNYIKHRLASDACLAAGLTAQATTYRSLAESQFARLMNKSQTRAPMQIRVNHPIGWRRR